jgi:small subunit ribosomal protein S20
VSGFNETRLEPPIQEELHSLNVCLLELWLTIYYYIGGVILANIKSAKKRILVNAKKTERNKAIKSKVKTMIKKVDSAIAAEDKELAKANLLVAIAEIDSACSKGVMHKNTAARKVSHITRKVNKLA